MKILSLLLLAAGGFALAGCSQDEYVYHDHYNTHHYSHSGGDTVAGEPSHMADPNTAESFRAESNTQ